MKKIVLGLATVFLSLGLLAGCNDDDDIPEVDDPGVPPAGTTDDNGESSDPNVGPSETTDPLVGDWWLGFEMSETKYYFNGTVYSSYYGGVTSEGWNAVVINIEAVTDGYTLSFVENDVIQYLNMTESDSNRNLTWTTDPYTWTYNETYKTFTVTDSTGVDQFIGTYGSNIRLSLSDIGYLTGTKSTSYAQYPAQLYEVRTFVIPSSIEVTGESEIEAGETTLLSITLTPSEDVYTTVNWTSSDESIATVSSSGRVTGLSEGEVVITATSAYDETISGSITITVTAGTIPENLICSYNFSNKTTSSTTAISSGETMKSILEASFVAGNTTTSVVTSVSSVSTVYEVAGGGTTNSGLQLSTKCLKFGKSSTAGSMTLTCSDEIAKVIVYATAWSSTSQTLTINNVGISMTQNPANMTEVSEVQPTEYTFTYSSKELSFSTTERVLLFAMEFYSA